MPPTRTATSGDVTDALDNPPLGWNEVLDPRVAATAQPGDPSKVQTLAYKDETIPVHESLDACFSLVSGIYVLDGAAGLAALKSQNGFVPHRIKSDGAWENVYPEDTLPPDMINIYHLISSAIGEVTRIANDAVARAPQFIANAANDRLLEARDEILVETVRYFPIANNSTAQAAAALESGGHLPFRDKKPQELIDLLAARIAVRGLRGVAEQERALASDRYRKALSEEVFSRYHWYGIPETYEPGELAEIDEAVLLRDPSIVSLRASADAQEDAAREYLTRQALRLPALWRFVDIDEPTDLELGTALFDALAEAYAANVELETTIKSDNTIVWGLPVLVRAVLADLAVPRYSIAWTAAEQQLAESGGSTASQVAMVSGFTLMGAEAMAALVGIATLGPLGVALSAIEIIASVMSAWADYCAYELQASAARAVLDPARSLGAEPSLFMTSVFVAMNLLPVTRVKGLAMVH